MKLLRFCLCWVSFLGLIASCHAQALAVRLDRLQYPHELRHELRVLEDPAAQFDVQALWDQPERFAPLGAGEASFGVTRSVWWLRLTLDNRAGPERELILSIRNPLLDEIRLALRHADGSVEQWLLGDRPIQPTLLADALDPAVPFELRPGEVADVLVAVRTSNFMSLGMWLADRPAYDAVVRLRSLWQGGLAALFASLFLYNLMLLKDLRDPVFLWYVAFLPVMWLTVATEYGFAGVYLFAHSPWWRNEGMLLFAGAMYVASTGFAFAFLDLRQLPRVRRALQVLMALAALQCLAAFALPLHRGFAMLSAAMFVFPVSLFAVNVAAWRTGQVNARYLMLSQGVAWVAQLLFAAWVLGWLPYHWLLRNALALGLSLSSLLMAVALADRIRLMRQSQAAAERAEREALQASKAALEQAVAQRTAELELARNAALREARQDALTGTRNRRAVLDEGTRMLALARRMAMPMSALMIDIDHFKKVNDEGGHADGDRVLIALVQCLSDALRISDLLGRMGGEEFLVLMPNTDRATAELVAERCRRLVAETLRSGARSLPVTVSIGVATWQSDDADLSGLIARADAALYQAKSAGRNRVCVATCAPGAPAPAGS